MNIKINRIKCGIVNCFLLQSNKGAVLIDAATPNSEAKIMQALDGHGVKQGDLRLLLITHGHEDHFGSAERLKEAYGVPTAMHPADSRPMPSMKSKGVAGRLLLTFSRSSLYRQPIFKPDIELCNGFRLDEYGIPAAVLHLPGHSAGSAGVLLDDGQLICGDMYMNFFGASLAHMFENYAELKESHRLLAGMGIKMVHPGHGKAFAPSAL